MLLRNVKRELMQRLRVTLAVTSYLYYPNSVFSIYEINRPSICKIRS